ncbi:MAG: hypothetical protein ACOY0T_08200 [Myxococcota bacterium]
MATIRFRASFFGVLAMAGGCGGLTPSGGFSEGFGGGVSEGGRSSAGDSALASGGSVSNKEPADGRSEISRANGGADAGGGSSTSTINTSVSGGNASTGGEPSGISGMGANAGGAPMPLPDGLVVHEWGTNTVVSASDGTLELGLQHEEEDLPAFVYDRLRAAVAEPLSMKVTTKMETPILYFYSKEPLDVSVRVDFPTGILTQWYPGVLDFRPQILWEQPLLATSKPQDPAMDPNILMPTLLCENRFRRNGWLDWGRFRVLAPGEAAPTLPIAPKDQYTWSYARDVNANAVKFPNGESERFLFYRGLSNAIPPVTIRALPIDAQGQRVVLENASGVAVPSAFVVHVKGDSGAFTEFNQGVGAGAKRELTVPNESELSPLGDYETALADAMTRALEAQALFHDEAVAMVNTWKTQWFKTPGIRVLYFAPSTWTDETIPLQITPKPAALVRVMVMRAEVLTPELESVDVAALNSTDETAMRAHFSKLGRFAEPRLRRALEQAPSAAGKALLGEIAVTVSRSSPTE